MSFNYDKSKESADQATQWSSYSDLFMALSVIFLLMYVTSSVREGATNIQKFSQYQELVQEADDLREQNRVYDALKDDYIRKQATEKETATYKELMSKLNLLQEKNKNEAGELQKQANDNRDKAKALNKYQQVIRNIINSSYVARARINQRDKKIDTQKEVITQKENLIEKRISDIRKLEETVKSKKRTIAKGKYQIKKTKTQLRRKITQLKRSYKNQKISRTNMRKKIASLEKNTRKQLRSLKQKNNQSKTQLKQASRKIISVNNALLQAKSTIYTQGLEKEKLAKQLTQEAERTRKRISKTKREFQAQRKLDRKRFKKALLKEALSKKQIAQKEKRFRQQTQKKQLQLKQKVSKLKRKMDLTQGQLQRAKSQIQARQKLAQQILRNFKKTGVAAQVNPRTGDVVLSFGKQYFKTGGSKLNPEMVAQLKKFMPIYAKSLFQNSKMSEKISNIEIIGFASPTYNGKYIDPNSLKPSHQKAVSYNLDLSFKRAKSIFNYIFDINKMTYKYQKHIRPMVKVTGRSFLAEGAQGRNIASSLKQKEYCKKFNCKKSQRVIIKFNLKN